MVKTKGPSKKQQKRGVDFKKIKRKVGRKLPPPKNTTNTEIKSKDALTGIRDIFLRYPTELRSHKLAVIEKLRELISDDDTLVRETLYQLLNQQIFQNYEEILRKNQFYLQDKGKLKNALAGLVHCLLLLPSNKEDHDSACETISSGKRDGDAQGILHAFEPETPKDPAGFSVISKKLKELVPVLISCFQDFIRLVHTMTQLDPQSFDCMLFILQSIDLVVKFFAYGIDNGQQELQVSMPPYEGLAATIQHQTIMPSLSKKLFDLFPLKSTYHLSAKDDEKYFALNILLTEIFLHHFHTTDWLCLPAALVEKFLEFVTSALSEEICSGTQSGKAFYEKHALSLVPFVPKLVLQVAGYWKSHILQAFTNIFRSCNLGSPLKWACLSAIEEMLVPRQGLYLDASDQELSDYQSTWIRELPLLLIMLGDKHPLRSKSVLSLILRLGQCAVLNSAFAQEYDNMQYSLVEFYCTCMDERNKSYGPFARLDTDAQELSICCLYYFTVVDSLLAWSCLYSGLEPFVLFRIIEVLHSAYKVGHIQIADHISFFITLLSCFKVLPEKSCPIFENDEISNDATFKSITSVVCSFLLQMGDDFLVFQILEKVVLDQIPLKPALDNSCAMLRVLVALDSRPTRLSQQSIINLSNFLPGYLIDVVTCFPEYDDEAPAPVLRSTSHYYLLPCYFLFYRSNKLLNLVLKSMGLLVTEKKSSLLSCATDHPSWINAIIAVVLLMHKDVKIRKILSSCKAEIELILQNTILVQSSEESNMAIEERHKMQSAVDQLKTIVGMSFSER